MKTLSLSLLPDPYSILRLEANRPVPSSLAEPHGRRQLVSISRTDRELSVVCPTSVSQRVEATRDQRSDNWVCFEVDGPLEFSETGILATLSAILARAAIPIFVVSSFDTDYLMVANSDRQRTVEQWTDAGIAVAVDADSEV